jgi:hypothetical protein
MNFFSGIDHVPRIFYRTWLPFISRERFGMFSAKKALNRFKLSG